MSCPYLNGGHIVSRWLPLVWGTFIFVFSKRLYVVSHHLLKARQKSPMLMGVVCQLCPPISVDLALDFYVNKGLPFTQPSVKPAIFAKNFDLFFLFFFFSQCNFTRRIGWTHPQVLKLSEFIMTLPKCCGFPPKKLPHQHDFNCFLAHILTCSYFKFHPPRQACRIQLLILIGHLYGCGT